MIDFVTSFPFTNTSLSLGSNVGIAVGLFMQNEDEFFARFDCGRQWYRYIAVLTGLLRRATPSTLPSMWTRERVHGDDNRPWIAVTEFAVTLLFEMA